MSNKTTPIYTRLTEQLHQHLKERAETHGVTFAEYIRHLLINDTHNP